jgi:hypothetical protein
VISAKIDPIDKDIIKFFDDTLSPAERSRILADFAVDQLTEAQEINRRALGIVPGHDTIVDGRRGAVPQDVRPDGTIVFDFELLDDLFDWIAEQLLNASPSLTGAYRQSHLFFADGEEIKPGAIVPQASEYLFITDSPYAGKIERGQSDAAPDGVYQVIAALAARRFGNLARIRFTYRSITGGRGRSDRRPAIVITVR